jgi:hypothetical protein
MSIIPENFIPASLIVMNMSRPAEPVLAFYNKRGTCEQWIKEGKGAIKPMELPAKLSDASLSYRKLYAHDHERELQPGGRCARVIQP